MAAKAAAIGFRVKTARAIAVVITGSASAPRVLLRREIDLTDPKMPDSKQPYHAALELPDAEGRKVVQRAVRAVNAAAQREFDALAADVEASGHVLRGVGFVVGSAGDPAKLGNLHVRAHALEGRLFWNALESAARERGVSSVSLVERDAYAKASESLGRHPDDLRRTVTELGREAGRPWGADEKTAVLAASVALARKR
jgi:hypothetical protein